MIHLVSRRALFSPVVNYAASYLRLQRGAQPVAIAPAAVTMRTPRLQQSSDFGLSTTVSEAELREAIRLATKAERDNWFRAGSAVGEWDVKQFGHLVRYWLARMADIPPSVLTFAQAKAIDSSTDYGELLNEWASEATIGAEMARVREILLGVGHSEDLNAPVEAALWDARHSRLNIDGYAWSAVFVVSCIRGAAIELGLERELGGLHVGRDELLLADDAHHGYVVKAFERRFGPDSSDGTYHAFRPDEHPVRPVQVGDIIVMDRQADFISDVVDFDDIPTLLLSEYIWHGDIVVDVASSYVETIGGNLDYGVKRRRLPLNSNGDGTLLVDREQLFTQEDDSGNLPALPVVDSAEGLNERSTGRIFTLLSPVASCEARLSARCPESQACD
jgi:hypothetical protein